MTKTKPRIAFITNCTQSSNYAPVVDIEDAPSFGTMRELLQWWTDNLANAPDDAHHTPGEIYSGISFDAVTEVANIVGHGNVYVVNRGAGLVRHTDLMLPYNFTYDRKDKHSAMRKVTAEKFMPILWWGMINEVLHDTATPIADLAQKYDHIIVALPKNFIKLIGRDVEAMGADKNKLLVIAPMSSVSALPGNVRSTFVPYASEYVSDIDYNRYNKPQKVALKFIQIALETGFDKHANEVREAQQALEDGTPPDQLNYDKLFQEHPRLLDAASPQEALSRAKLMGIRIGAKMKFMGAWYGAQGQLDEDYEDDQLDDATAAMSAMIETMEGATNTEAILKGVGLFIEALRKVGPMTVFRSKDVAAWAKRMYPDRAERQAHGLNSSGRIANVLSSYTNYLGLEAVAVGTKAAYKLKED